MAQATKPKPIAVRLTHHEGDLIAHARAGYRETFHETLSIEAIQVLKRAIRTDDPWAYVEDQEADDNGVLSLGERDQLWDSLDAFVIR